MKQLYIAKRIGIIFMTIVFFVISSPASVRAASEVDLDKKGSITVNLSDKDFSVTGMQYKLYKIAELTDTGTYQLTSDFSGSNVQLNTLSKASDIAATAKTLAAYAKINNTTGTSKILDASGIIKFDQLIPGYYLVVQPDPFFSQKLISYSAPFLLTIPMKNIGGNGWVYDISAYPKVETIQPGNPPDPIVPAGSNDVNTGITASVPTVTPPVGKTTPSGAAPSKAAVEDNEDNDENTEIDDDPLPAGALKEGKKKSGVPSTADDDTGNHKKKGGMGVFDLPRTGGSIAYAVCKYGGILLILCGLIVYIISRIRRIKNKRQ